MTSSILFDMRLASSPSGTCMDLPGNSHVAGAKVRLYECNKTPAQSFKLDAQGDKTEGERQIKDFGRVADEELQARKSAISPRARRARPICATCIFTAFGPKPHAWPCGGGHAYIHGPGPFGAPCRAEQDREGRLPTCVEASRVACSTLLWVSAGMYPGKVGIRPMHAFMTWSIRSLVRSRFGKYRSSACRRRGFQTSCATLSLH